MGWQRHKKMYMIFGDVTFQNFYILSFANLTDQVTDTNGHVSKENRFAVFRDPYYMNLQIGNGMNPSAIMLHNTANLLKSSPKGEGFSPIPRMEH